MLDKGFAGAVIFSVAFFWACSVYGQDGQVSLASSGKEAFAENELYYGAVKAHMVGDEKESDSLMLAFVRINPNIAAAYYELARYRIKQNNTAEATTYIKKAIQLDDANKWYKDQYANILVIDNKFEEAADIYKELASREEYNEEYLQKAALLYQRAGKYKEALALLDKLLLKTGLDEDVLIHKQQIYLKMNDLGKAAKVIEELIAQNPREAKYYTLLAELYDNNKETAKAETLFLKAQKSFPNDPSLQLGLAEHYRKMNDSVRYNKYISETITNKDLDAETQLGLLAPYLQNMQNDAVRKKTSLDLITQIAAQHPNDAAVLAVYGDVLSFNDQRNKAIVQYKKSVAIDPSRYVVWEQLLYGYTARKDADSLIYYSDKALRLFPNQALIHYLNGIGKANAKNYTGAINAINRAVDLQPEDNTQLLSEMYSSLGDVYNSAKKFELSDKSFDRALSFYPNNASLLNNYSYYLSERGTRLADAEKMSKHSLDLRPGEATFLDTYGWILYKEAKFDKAKEYIQQAVNANPADADGTLFEHLGDVYYKLNDKDRAVQNWQIAKDKGIENPLIDKKIQEKKLYE
jgi:tetratricopeptide (TPR) repeat protein